MKARLPFLIVLGGLLLRLFLINWDQGFHLHPDERAIIMATLTIHFFNNLNPHFFNYGSLPLYLLSGSAQLLDFLFHTTLDTYAGLLYLGRVISALFDSFTIFLIYVITLRLFPHKNIALFASFFYAIAFFPIQNSHFFVVDVFMTFFMTFVVLCTLNYMKKPSWSHLIPMGLGIGFGLGTKVTAVLFLIPALVVPIIVWKKDLIKILISYLVLGIAVGGAFFIAMPYALLDYQEFIQAVTLQTTMNNNAYIFPYTLQYVYTMPYWYYLKNIFLWGLGPFISILSLIGMIFYIKRILILPGGRIGKGSPRASMSTGKGDSDRIWQNNKVILIFIVFYLFYFLIIGHSAVKFMRYMLPLYPFFAIFAGYGLYQITNSKIQTPKFIGKFLIVGAMVWTGLFMMIYMRPTTRVSATNWIGTNIKAGSTILVEHWDDRLPILGSENYDIQEMTLYDLPDDSVKWDILSHKLFEADYIIIASNRLYVPLMRLADCTLYIKCYPKTADYYDRLFHGIPFQTPYGPVSYKKVAEFVSYPGIQVGEWKFELKDDAADESFTVYDHPKIFIYKHEK